MKLTTPVRAVAGGLVAAAGIRYVFNSVATFGFTRAISNRPYGQAKRVSAEGLIGVEDIAIDQERGVAYLSAADRRRERNCDKKKVGGLFRYDLTTPDATPERISDDDIYPHGISLWCAPDGHRELYAIDHADTGERVRRYRIDDSGLQLVEVFRHELIRSPNDLTVVGDREFYVTNDHKFTSDAAQNVEHFLRLPLSDVVHFEGGNYQVALRNVPYANGIVWEPVRKKVFVAALSRREVWSCDVTADGRLVKRWAFTTDMAVDNIEIGTDGKLWIGGHPKVLDLVRHDKDMTHLSPSEVIAMDPDTGTVTTVYENDGSEISGSSVGANWRNRLLVGSVMEPFILDCTLST